MLALEAKCDVTVTKSKRIEKCHNGEASQSNKMLQTLVLSRVRYIGLGTRSFSSNRILLHENPLV
jgi:hypothetical protein